MLIEKMTCGSQKHIEEALAKIQTKPKSKTVETYLITCKHCGYSWYSATQSTDRMSCGRCRGRIKVPDEIRALNASRRLD